MIDSPRTPPLRFRMTIRGLLVVNVYLAVVLTCIIATMRWSGSARTFFVVLAGMGLPQILMFVTAAVIRPGAWRDWLITSFGHLSVLGLAVAGFLASLIAVPCALSVPPRLPQPFEKLVPIQVYVDTVLVVLGDLGLWFVLAWMVYLRFPVRCPVCHRRALVGTTGKGAALRYYSCGACGSRCKQIQSAPPAWEDASRSEDDQFYFLGTLGSFFRGLRKRRPPAGRPRAG